jgi:hypothetical protein
MGDHRWRREARIHRYVGPRCLARPGAPTPFEVVTAEILALRTLDLHVQLAPFGGEPVTAESLRRLMAAVDEDKLRQARESLMPALPRRIR